VIVWWRAAMIVVFITVDTTVIVWWTAAMIIVFFYLNLLFKCKMWFPLLFIYIDIIAGQLMSRNNVSLIPTSNNACKCLYVWPI
jgi:hypothetical protein